MPCHHRDRQRLIRNKVFYVAEIMLKALPEYSIFGSTTSRAIRRGVLYILHEYISLRKARTAARAMSERALIRYVTTRMIEELRMLRRAR